MSPIVVKWEGHPTSIGWVVDDNGCHIWQGERVGRGYGRVRHRGRMQMVHRVRYEMEIGPIPEGYELDHYVCNNGPGGCCNPHHCRPVTTRENTLRGDGISSVCRARTHCPRGHALSGNNLQEYHKVRGNRSCQTCAAARQRAQHRARSHAHSLGLRRGTPAFSEAMRAVYPRFRDEAYAEVTQPQEAA